MTHRGTDPAGHPLGLDGAPLQPGRGSVPGLVIRAKEQITMAKASRTGRYVLNGHYFRVRKGDELPKGAQMVDDAKPEQRAQKAAPENKAKAAPEQK